MAWGKIEGKDFLSFFLPGVSILIKIEWIVINDVNIVHRGVR